MRGIDGATRLDRRACASGRCQSSTLTRILVLAAFAGACHDPPASAPQATLRSTPSAKPGRALTIATEAEVYVLERGSGALRIVDRTTFALLATLPVGASPTTLAVSPDRTRVYATVTGAVNDDTPGRVAEIDVGARSLAASIPVGDSPWGIVVTPDGRYAYVSDVGDHVIHVVHLGDRAVVQTIAHPSLDTPQGMALTPDGAYLYVANVAFLREPSAPQNVTVIRTSDNTVVETIDLSGQVAQFGPWDVTMMPDGRSAYTNDGDNGEHVFVINTDATASGVNSVTASIGLPSGMWGPRGMESGITPRGERVFAALMESDQVAVIDPTTNAIAHSISTGPGSAPWRSRLSPDGTLWISLRDAGTVLVVDAGTYAEITRISGLSRPADIVFVTPLGATEHVALLDRLIVSTYDAGYLHLGQARALRETLAQASRLMARDEVAAISVLSAFQRQVEGLMRHALPPAEGQKLIAEAGRLIETILAT